VRAKDEREAAEARASERATGLPEGDYFANSHFVAKHTPERGIENVLECETHWDACLVLLARHVLKQGTPNEPDQ